MTTPSAPLRWGILGPGRIAAAVAQDFAHVRAGVIGAVASRSFERAEAFVAQHSPGASAFGSYEELLTDPDIDAVYIATPHAQHARLALAAIEAGKPILVEKAFTTTYASTARVVEAARSREVFAMEALWSRFLPSWVLTRTLIAEGAIGQVRSVSADLGINRPFDPQDRLFNLALGGGTMFDLGVYVMHVAQMVLGEPVAVTARGSLLPTGVDAESGMLVDFGEGRTATLLTSFRTPSPGAARIYGTEGWLEIPPRFHHPDSVVLHRHGSTPEVLPAAPAGAGYALEFDEVARVLAAGKTESSVMPLDATLAVMRILDDASRQLGVAMPDDLAEG